LYTGQASFYIGPNVSRKQIITTIQASAQSGSDGYQDGRYISDRCRLSVALLATGRPTNELIDREGQFAVVHAAALV